MKALVVRKTSDNSLVCFGPHDGMYNPGTPVGAIKKIEPDYDAVLVEWQATQPVPVNKKSVILANPAVPQWFKDYIV